MSVFTAEKGEKLRGLMEEEKGLLEQIDTVTGEQSKLLSDGEAERFDRSLDRRQRLIDKLGELHRESDVLMQAYVSADGKSGAIERLRGQLRELAAGIAKEDEKNLAKAKELAEQYTEQTNKLSMSRKSIGLYNQGMEYGGEYFDKST